MNNSWPTVLLTTPKGASATLFEYGAHLSQWQTAQKNSWIFMSESAVFEHGQPIRGGVPIVFPQFNTRGPGPKHGFLRNADWKVVTPATQTAEGAECVLAFSSNTETLKQWPYAFAAEFKVLLTDTSLSMTLNITNTGDKEFSFNSALHTYFSIGQLNATRVQGIEDTAYWDNGTPFEQRQTFEDNTLALNDAIDRVFFNTKGPLHLINGKHQLRIEQTGFVDVVVWNPGVEGAKAIGDLKDQEYNNMLCIEAAAIDHAITLQPGESWHGTQSLHEEQAL